MPKRKMEQGYRVLIWGWVGLHFLKGCITQSSLRRFIKEMKKVKSRA